ncbi:MAG: hypothetical protein ABI665_13720 [Vicinamibacterales bacterium]
MSVVMGVMLIPIVWFIGPDWPDWIGFAGHPVTMQVRLMTRAVSVAIPIVGLLMISRADTHRVYSRTVLGVSLAMALILLGINLQRPFGTALHMRTPLMFVIAMYGAFPNTFRRQITAPLLFTAGAILLRIFWLTDSSGGDRATDILILLVVNLTGVAMVYRRRVLEREVSALWERESLARADAERAFTELKTLRGIINICAYCQKIHDEAGAWQQIEAYVREHTEAEFSHGICPDCLTEHFPGL